MKSILLAVLAVTLLGPAYLPGQTLKTGERVRVSAPVAFPGTKLVGTVEALDSTQLLLSRQGSLQSGPSLQIPLSSIRSIEVSRGKLTQEEAFRQGLKRGALSGAVVGVALGGLYGYGRDSMEDPESESSDRRMVRYGLTTGATLGVLGAVINAAFQMRSPEQWEHVALPRPELRPVSHEGRWGFEVAVTTP